MKINLFMNFNGKLLLFRNDKKKDDTNYIETTLIKSQAYINNIKQKYKSKSKEVTIQIYKINTLKNKIKLYGKDFIIHNKKKCNLIINNKQKYINESIKNKKFFNKKGNLKVKLIIFDNIIHISKMFENCTTLLSVSAYTKLNNINHASNMCHLFSNCTSLNNAQILSYLNTNNVNNMSYMFYNCTSLSSLNSISHLNTNKVTDMSFMFFNCNSLKVLPYLSNFNVKNVRSMNSMFSHCTSLKLLNGLSHFNTCNVTDMSNMFSH